MPEEKLYIRDVEKILKVYRKKLYDWERAGKIPRSRREFGSNYRYWTPGEVKKIQRIMRGERSR